MSDLQSTQTPVLLSGTVQEIKYLQQILWVVMLINLGSSQAPI